jgi:hypothetical protein
MSGEVTTESNNTQFIGKKVFFLYPHSVMQQEMLDILINNEYEVYLINDHKKMLKVTSLFPDSILFINIDNVITVGEWITYIKSIMSDNNTKIQIGIVTYNNNPELAKKFLMEIMVPCGFIVLNLGLEKSIPILLKILDANEAKGRRKYIRALSAENDNTKFNVNIGTQLYTGKILDISIAGMAAVFDKTVEIEIKTRLNDIQLVLKGIICRVSGVIAGSRKGAESFYVILFEFSDDRAKSRIHSYIHKCLQDSMDEILKKL